MVMQRILILISIACILLTFQNCSFVKPEAGGSRGHTKGNGDGYAGKIYSASGFNVAGQFAERSRIEIDLSGRPFLVKDNFQTIAPTPVSFGLLNLLAHNLENLIFQERVFQIVTAQAFSSLLCRADALTSDNTQRHILDAIVQEQDGQLFGRVKLGIYSVAEELQQVIEFSVPVTRTEVSDGTVSYIGHNTPGGETFTLHRHPDGRDYVHVTLKGTIHPLVVPNPSCFEQ